MSEQARAPGGTGRPGPLLRTKLLIPPLRPNRVPRPRLTARLDGAVAAGHKLLLVSAPAGFGKTTLLSEWAHAGAEIPSPRRVAWLSLDEGDNDLARFLSYLFATLQTVAPGLGAIAPSGFGLPQPPPVEAVLAALINELAERAAAAGTAAGPLVLVLDDYHDIEAQDVHDVLAFLLEHLPPQVHLAIATRADPPLPLARLRGRGQLAELRVADLRFTPEEAMAFLSHVMGLGLTPEQVAALESRTEGWIAGLQLAALSVEGQDSERIDAFVQAFAGDDRYILDYLVEEVLQAQPDRIQTFLLHSSILNRLCGPLCDALLPATAPGAEQPSQHTLEYLDATNLFLVPLDQKRRWYRYHHLFADLLRHRLQQIHPQRIPELHRRASRWHEENGSMAEAIGHALSAAEFERAAGLIERSAWNLWARGGKTTLLTWLDALPGDLVRSRPRLSVLYGWGLLAAMQMDAVEPHLRDAEQAVARSPATGAVQGEVTVIRATVASIRGENRRAAKLAEEALALLPEQERFLRGIVINTLGAAYDWLGESAAASRAFAQAARLCREAGNPLVGLIAMANLGRLQETQGCLHEAAQIYRQALEFAAEQGRVPLPVSGLAHVGLGRLWYEWNDLEAAAHHLSQGIELGQRMVNIEIQVAGCLGQARLRQARGDDQGALQAVDEAGRLVRRYPVAAGIAAEVGATRARLWAMQGRLSLAARWAEQAGLGVDDEPTFARESDYLTFARLLIAQARCDKAVPLLERLLGAAEEHGRMGRAIEILVLQAMALRASGAATAALVPVGRALSLAEPEGYTRVFLDEGGPMATLLRAAAAKGKALDYVRNLLAAFAAPGPPPLPTIQTVEAGFVEPLSERELEVLQLLAAGLSNREIAQRLYLTVGTIKWHAHNIYGKLAVSSRTQAVARARELGLLREP